MWGGGGKVSIRSDFVGKERRRAISDRLGRF
jgi:hypothetical protein